MSGALQRLATYLTQLDEALSLSLQFGIVKREVDQ